VPTIVPVIAFALLTLPVQQDHKPAAKPLQCMSGPIQRSFGGTEWLTYGCDDRRTLIVVSAPDNPATPFVFTITKTNRGLRISGEGNGDQRSTAPAFEDLKKLSEEVFDQMLREAETRP
jgi:hypothetical protein